MPSLARSSGPTVASSPPIVPGSRSSTPRTSAPASLRCPTAAITAAADGGLPHARGLSPLGSRLSVGTHVVGGTVIARMGAASGGVAAHLNFSIRPAGLGASQIDPKPILDGWKLLEATAIYRADGKNPFSHNLGISGVLLLSKQALQQRVLADHNLSLPPCEGRAVASAHVDRRVLAMLEYLVAEGYRLKVSALRCRHARHASAAASAEHSSADSVNISAVDGVSLGGQRGRDSLTESVIKTVLRLQGAMHPQQVIAAGRGPGGGSPAPRGQRSYVHIAYLPSFAVEYVSPFLNATTGRIDQGVDFTGTGPILAVGEAEILQTGAPGWPEGGGVLYRLLEGSRSGEVIYVFEGARATVRAGEKVSAGEQIATFIPGGSIEMGFANAAGVPFSHGEYREGLETVWGGKMAAFLASIGGSAVLAPSLGKSGSSPSAR